MELCFKPLNVGVAEKHLNDSTVKIPVNTQVVFYLALLRPEHINSSGD